MNNRILNWQRQPEDARDFITNRPLKVAHLDLPSKFELPLQIPIYDQGNLGSCTANSGGACFRFESAQVLGNFDFDPSRLFLYYTTRALEGTTSEDAGAYIRDVFKALNKTGISLEKTWPYVETKFASKPPQAAYTEALNNIAVQYAAVPQTATSIKQTLLDGGAISFGFDVYSSFMGSWESTGGKMPNPNKSSEMILGGHAVTIIGWDDTKFGSTYYLIQNSWGTGWGNEGKFWMSEKFLLSDSCSDFWVIEKISQTAPTPTPEPTTDAKSFALAVFANETELKKLQESSLVKLGVLLGLDVNESYTKKKNLATFSSFLFG